MNSLLPLIACALALCACGGRTSQEEEAAFPVQKITGLDMAETKNGLPDWKLKTPSAKILEKAGKALLTTPEMEFLENNAVVSRITAEQSELLLETRDMVLTGNVVAHSLKDQTVLRTSLLRYSPSRKKVYTDREVIITRDGTRVKGRNFEANPDLSELSIENQETLVPEGAK